MPQDDTRPERGDLVDRPSSFRDLAKRRRRRLVLRRPRRRGLHLADGRRLNTQANRIEKIIDQAAGSIISIARSSGSPLGPIESRRRPGDATRNRRTDPRGERPSSSRRPDRQQPRPEQSDRRDRRRLRAAAGVQWVPSDPDTVIKVPRTGSRARRVGLLRAARTPRQRSWLLDVSMEIEAWVVPERRGR